MCNITKLRISATFIISHHHHHIRPECLLCFFLLALLLPLHKLFTSHSHTTPTRLPRAEVTREKLVHFHLQTGGGYIHCTMGKLDSIGWSQNSFSHFSGKRSKEFSEKLCDYFPIISRKSKLDFYTNQGGIGISWNQMFGI